jgi:hypothetical protein
MKGKHTAMASGSLFLSGSIPILAAMCAVGARAYALDASMQTQIPQVESRQVSAVLPVPEHHQRRLPPIGITVSSFTPFSGKTRDAFGGHWIEVGPGFGSASPERTHAMEPSVSALSRRHDGSKLLILQAGVKYLVSLAGTPRQRQGTRVVPYAGLKGYFTYAKVETVEDTGHSTHVVPGATAVLGVGIGKAYFVEAQARFFPKMNGYDFSGAELEAGLRF